MENGLIWSITDSKTLPAPSPSRRGPVCVCTIISICHGPGGFPPFHPGGRMGRALPCHGRSGSARRTRSPLRGRRTSGTRGPSQCGGAEAAGPLGRWSSCSGLLAWFPSLRASAPMNVSDGIQTRVPDRNRHSPGRGHVLTRESSGDSPQEPPPPATHLRLEAGQRNVLSSKQGDESSVMAEFARLNPQGGTWKKTGKPGRVFFCTAEEKKEENPE